MNAYVYQGMDRYSATEDVNGNAILETNWDYAVSLEKGMLLVVYPNKDSETEFEFEYFVGPYNDPYSAGFYVQLFLPLGLVVFCFCMAFYMNHYQANHNNKVEVL